MRNADGECICGGNPKDIKHISLRPMAFTISFNPLSKPVQKFDWGMIKEMSPEKIKQLQSVEELEIKQISERAMDDLTGASYRSDDDGWVLCGEILVPPDQCEKKEQDTSGGNDGNNGGDSEGGNGGGSDQTPNDFDGTSGDAPMPPQKAVNSDGDQASGVYSSSSPNGGVDPTNPTNGGCGDDYDYRPNPEEYRNYGSLSAVALKDMSNSNEVDLVLTSMSVDSMSI